VDLRLREIPELADELYSLGPVERDDRPRWITECDEAGNERRVQTNWPADPVAYVLTSGPIPGASRAPRVAGSRERGVPVRLDLLGRPDTRSVSDPNHDQAGPLPVAAVLDSWCRDWITHDWCGGSYLPEPTIRRLVDWLRIRLEDAMDQHPAISDFCEEVREIHLALLRANGRTEPKPELCEGVPCSSCGKRLVYRTPGYYECDPERRYEGCQTLLTESEFQSWAALNAGHFCGAKNLDDDGKAWWCALPKHHDGDCERYRREDAA